MKVYEEKSILDFEFWGEAKEHAEMLTEAELKEFEKFVEAEYLDGVSTTDLNDWMWFDFEDVCAIVGVKYDSDNDCVIRG